MKTVYVIAAGIELDVHEKARDVLEKARKALSLEDNVEIICVNDINDVPIQERIKSDPSIIQHIYQIKAPIIHEHQYCYVDNKSDKKLSQQGWKNRNKYKR